MLSSARLRAWRLLSWIALWVRLVGSGKWLDMKVPTFVFLGPGFGRGAAVLYV